MCAQVVAFGQLKKSRNEPAPSLYGSDNGVIQRQRFKSQKLASVLAHYDDFLQQLFADLQRLEQTQPDERTQIYETYFGAIANAVGGKAFAIYENQQLVYCYGNNYSPDECCSQDALFEQALKYETEVFQLDIGSRLTTKARGGQDIELITLPFLVQPRKGLMILRCANEQEQELILDEVVHLTLRELYLLSDGLSKRVPITTIKCRIFDVLKSQFRYVSETVFMQRLELFKSALNEIEMHFEPIYRFDKTHQSSYIYGWEALARIEGSEHAPANMLETAELWGKRFKAELDIHTLETAVKTYDTKAREIECARADEIRPLSVNIYPETIFRQAYHDKLEELLAEKKLIPGSKLILEVSEKSIINEAPDYLRNEDDLQTFIEHMATLRSKYRLSFAIDDFGAGYSSITRLNSLKPDWVKVDRQVLYCEPQMAKSLINNLLSVKTNWGHEAFKVIVEGVDEDCDITLDELINEVDVEYVQGYLLGKANPEIFRRPNKSQNHKINMSVGWD